MKRTIFKSIYNLILVILGIIICIFFLIRNYTMGRKKYILLIGTVDYYEIIKKMSGGITTGRFCLYGFVTKL